VRAAAAAALAALAAVPWLAAGAGAPHRTTATVRIGAARGGR
jgi:hypothetical protein